MKTAITVLQEMMIKRGPMPEYDCISQSGPKHLATFEYRCKAMGTSVTAQARTKKEAKQEAARLMLLELSARGLPVPPPYNCQPNSKPEARPPSPPSPINKPALMCGEEGVGVGGVGVGVGEARGYVALLKELCEQYRLGAVQYSLVADTGPPHARRFTVAAALARHERSATATTKKMARQLAAELLYKYLRQNLDRLTVDFVENPGNAANVNMLAGVKRLLPPTELNLGKNQEKDKYFSGTCHNEEQEESAPKKSKLEIQEEALARAHEKAMERYVEMQTDQVWRPDLSQKVADYHLGLLTHIEEEARTRAILVLCAAGAVSEERAEQVLESVAGALGLRVERPPLPGLAAVALAPACPPLVLAAPTAPRAAAAALRYLRRALQHRTSPKTA